VQFSTRAFCAAQNYLSHCSPKNTSFSCAHAAFCKEIHWPERDCLCQWVRFNQSAPPNQTHGFCNSKFFPETQGSGLPDSGCNGWLPGPNSCASDSFQTAQLLFIVIIAWMVFSFHLILSLIFARRKVESSFRPAGPPFGRPRYLSTPTPTPLQPIPMTCISFSRYRHIS
jgi:hypothetical protein